MSSMTIGPEQAKQHVVEGDALLICAYDSQEKFASSQLEGAISFADFRAREKSLSKDQELIFYCG